MNLLARLLDPKTGPTLLQPVKRPLYSWVLCRPSPFEPLEVLPPDPWVGSVARGRALLNRVLHWQGEPIDLNQNIWTNAELAAHTQQGAVVHGFEWLRDLRALGGDQARRVGRAMLQEWLLRNRHASAYIWDYPVTANRIAAWLMSYDFFFASAEDDFQDLFYTSFKRQAAHLERANMSELSGLAALSVIRGRIFANISLKQSPAAALSALDSWIVAEVDGEGMHVSRKAAHTLRAVHHLIDLRGGLVRAGIAAPTMLQSAIERMVHATRFFRMPDQKLATLQATQEGEAENIEAIFKLSGVRVRKSPTYLQESGYQSLLREKTHVIVDCGAPQSTPYDVGAHASPLAFEMAVGKERMVVSCGTSKSDPVWAEYLRATAAHSGLVLDDRNAFELIKSGGLGRRGHQVTVNRDVTPEGVALGMSHNGYMSLSGLMHKRTLTLSAMGNVFEGLDQLLSEVPLVKPVNYCVRFHLHPRVQASLIQGGEAVLLRLPSGAGWRFYKDKAELSLEPSIYCGASDEPRKTMQIVLSGVATDVSTDIRWQFIEES